MRMVFFQTGELFFSDFDFEYAKCKLEVGGWRINNYTLLHDIFKCVLEDGGGEHGGSKGRGIEKESKP